MSVNGKTRKTKTKKKDYEFIELVPPKKIDVIIENENKLGIFIDDEQSINETLKKSFLKHLEMTFNVSQSLKRAGLSSKQYNLFLENDEEFSQSVKDLTNSLIDIAQSKLLKLITIDPVWIDDDGNPQKHPACAEFVRATTFLLDRLGASRGWNGEPIPDLFKEKQDNTIEIIIVKPDGTKKPKRKTLGPIDETN